jgi:hypothetical protein
VNVPRFRIAWVMIAVAIVALDFGAIRALLGSQIGAFLLLGALPMANVLAVGILVGQQCPGSCPFLLGFEIFGAMALASYVAVTCLFIEPTATSSYLRVLTSYLSLVVDPIDKNITWGRPFVVYPILCVVAVVMLGWPNLAFALLGGFLSRRFKVTIARRR